MTEDRSPNLKCKFLGHWFPGHVGSRSWSSSSHHWGCVDLCWTGCSCPFCCLSSRMGAKYSVGLLKLILWWCKNESQKRWCLSAHIMKDCASWLFLTPSPHFSDFLFTNFDPFMSSQHPKAYLHVWWSFRHPKVGLESVCLDWARILQGTV